MSTRAPLTDAEWAEFAEILASAGAVVYFHDADCPACKGGTCTKLCGERAYARRPCTSK